MPTDTSNNQLIDFYLAAPHACGRGSFLVYLSLIGLWASEGESWANRNNYSPAQAREGSLAYLKKFKGNGAKYTGLTIDSIMQEAPGANSLSKDLPVIRLVRDPINILASYINEGLLQRFFKEGLYRADHIGVFSAKDELEPLFANHGLFISNWMRHESSFLSIVHRNDVRVVDTAETMPDKILDTLKRVAHGFELSPYEPTDFRFFQSYGQARFLLLDTINVLQLEAAGQTAEVKVWPDFLSYRLVNWRNLPTRRLARYVVNGKYYHAVQLIPQDEPIRFPYIPDKHLPRIVEFTQRLDDLLNEVTEKFAPYKISQTEIAETIRHDQQLYDTFMDYWEKEWSPVEKLDPGHIERWWKNGLLVAGQGAAA